MVAADADEVVAQALAVDVAAARAGVDAAVVQARVVARQHASRASQSSRSSAWRRKRPSVRVWRRRSVARRHHHRRQRRVMPARMACSCRQACLVYRRALGRRASWQDSRRREEKELCMMFLHRRGWSQAFCVFTGILWSEDVPVSLFICLLVCLPGKKLVCVLFSIFYSIGFFTYGRLRVCIALRRRSNAWQGRWCLFYTFSYFTSLHPFRNA